MVTPYRRSAISIVFRLCVMRMNWVCSCMPAQHLDEPSDVGIVERRVDLVEQAERAGLVLEEREHQRDRGQRLLAAGEQLDALQALARRLRDDLDAALDRVVLVEQGQPGASAAEERAEDLLEVTVDGGERLGEPLPGRFVDALDGLGGLGNRVDQVLALRRQEGVAGFELVELVDGHHVDRAKAIDPGAQLGDGFLGAERALLGRGDGRVGNAQVVVLSAHRRLPARPILRPDRPRRWPARPASLRRPLRAR